MVASPVRMPLRPLPASITLVLSKPPQSTAKPLKTSGH